MFGDAAMLDDRLDFEHIRDIVKGGEKPVVFT